MTGYRSDFLRHNCSRAGCFITTLPCWNELIEQFPRNIRPTDVDGYVEINGHFLFLEQKGEGVPFGNNPGQFKAMRVLAGLPDVTVLFFRPGVTTDFEFLLLDSAEHGEVRECSKGQLFAWLRRWAEAADRSAVPA